MNNYECIVRTYFRIVSVAPYLSLYTSYHLMVFDKIFRTPPVLHQQEVPYPKSNA